MVVFCFFLWNSVCLAFLMFFNAKATIIEQLFCRGDNDYFSNYFDVDVESDIHVEDIYGHLWRIYVRGRLMKYGRNA